jgi:hypothetical protein
MSLTFWREYLTTGWAVKAGRHTLKNQLCSLGYCVPAEKVKVKLHRLVNNARKLPDGQVDAQDALGAGFSGIPEHNLHNGLGDRKLVHERSCELQLG